eukprot:TRINITY_DN42894_c0_g1_i1.p1 TRINITY_DN42894_c0_g1~~TRINITY_DN42894_c0_g1_i1.p1  ORF type:complete len:349 (-),score=41.46 TRINITY_DN42894_c0_g1_i1:172-1218(-)
MAASTQILGFCFLVGIFSALSQNIDGIDCHVTFSAAVGGMVWGLTADEDAGLLIAASLDHSVYVWNTSTTKEMYQLEGHHDEVWRVGVLEGSSPAQIVTASLDGTVRLWTVRAGDIDNRTLFNTGFMITALATSIAYVLHGDKGGQIGVWRRSHQELSWVGQLQADKKMLQAIALLPSGLAVTASDDGMLRLWDLDLQEHLRSWHASSGSIVSMAVAHDGTLVTSGYDRIGIREPWELRQWDVVTGMRLSASSRFGVVTSLALHASGLLLVGGPDGAIFALELPGWNVVEALPGHEDAVHALHALGDGSIWSAGVDLNVKLWTCEMLQCDKSHGQSNGSAPEFEKWRR